MSEILDTLHTYFQLSIIRYALIVGLLIALCSSLLGVTLVMKRFSFIGDGLSHVAFGAMAVATVTGVTNNMLIIMPVTIASAILLLRTGSNTKIKGDAAIAMISVGALALGYMLMNIAAKSGNKRTSSNITADVCSTLFGSTSILTLTLTDVWICVGMSVIVVAVFLIFYNSTTNIILSISRSIVIDNVTFLYGRNFRRINFTIFRFDWCIINYHYTIRKNFESKWNTNSNSVLLRFSFPISL